MKINKAILFGSSLFLGLAIAGVVGFTLLSKPAIVYVDNQVLFDGFKMKKELEQELTKRKEEQNHVVDSLKGQLMAMESAYETIDKNKKEQFEKEFLAKRNQWITLSQQIESANQELEAKFTKQVWTQLNQYVNDYGKEKNFDFIIGANGDGSLMFAKESTDITEELTDYANKHYESKN